MTQRYQMDNMIVIPRTIVITTPAAGAEFNYTSAIPTWDEIISVSCVFTADANVANRRIGLTVSDVTGIIGRGQSTVVLAAAAVIGCSFSPFVPATSDNATPFNVVAPLTGRIFLPFNGQINSITELIQVGDQYTAILLHVHRRYMAF